MEERKIGIFIGYLNIFLQSIIGFLYVPMLLSFIGKSGYGLYQLVGSFIAYFGIMDFGLSSAIVRYYSKYNTEKNFVAIENLLAISFRFYLLIAVGIISVGALSYYGIDYFYIGSLSVDEVIVVKKLFALLLFNLILSISTMVFRAVINGHEKFLFLKGLETIQLILQPIFVLLFLNYFPSAVTVAIVQTILNFIIVCARIYYCFFKLKIKIKFHQWDKEMLKGFKTLAASIFVVSLVDKIFYKTNQIVLGSTSGADAVAVYSIAALIYMNYAAISEAVSSVYLPHVTQVIGEKNFSEKISSLFIQIGRWQFYILGLVSSGFIIYGKQFIKLWAGEGFQDAYIITLLIILPFTIDLIQNIGLSIMQALNKYAFRAKLFLVMGSINLLFVVPISNKYGGIGCAMVTGIVMLLGNGLVMNWYYRKILGLDVVTFWKQISNICFGVIALTIFGWGLNNVFYSENLIIYLLKIILYTIVYSCVMYKFYMNNYERLMIKSTFSMIEI